MPGMAIRTYPNLFAFFRAEGRIQDTIAQELGISPALLSMFKWGLRQPDLALALRIADRCRVPLESLVKVQRPQPAKATPRAAAGRKLPTLRRAAARSAGSPGPTSQVGKNAKA